MTEDRVYSKPSDQSLEAYKGFVATLAAGILGDEAQNLTEDEWVELWKEYWASVGVEVG